MCFSAEADLVTGIVITAIGIDALRSAEHPSEKPLAALPLLLGTHQLIEAAVWWGVVGNGPVGLARWSAWVYLGIAFGLLPWFVPWAVRRIEPDRVRNRIMQRLVVLGALVSAYLMWAVIAGPVEVTDGGYYLDYSVPLSWGGYVVALYVVATCGSLLLSTDRYVVIFGAVNVVIVVALWRLLQSGVISLWCVWAAMASAIIGLHMRRFDDQRHRRLAEV
jgi:hypothetical protein